MNTPQTIPKPLDRDEWLAARRPFFNASAASVLWDRHPYQTPGDYATTKLTGNEPVQTRAMQRGLRLEDVIATWWADDHRCKVVEPQVLYVRGRVMATVDRVVLTGSPLVLEGTPIEIKSAAQRVTEPRSYWIDQCQAIMWTVDAAEMELVWFDSSMELHDVTVYRDEEFGPELANRAEQFMASIDMGIVPDWVTLSYDNMAAIYPAPAGRVPLGDEGLRLVRVLDTIRLIRKDAEKDEQRVKDQLARLLRGNEVGTWAGVDVVTWKAIRPGTKLNAKRLAEDHPDLVAGYMEPQPAQRRMLVHLGGET